MEIGCNWSLGRLRSRFSLLFKFINEWHSLLLDIPLPRLTKCGCPDECSAAASKEQRRRRQLVLCVSVRGEKPANFFPAHRCIQGRRRDGLREYVAANEDNERHLGVPYRL